jgi:hypothetical protein
VREVTDGSLVRDRAALVLSAAGALVVFATVLLFYTLGDSAERSVTFGFTVAYTSFQVVVLFASLALVALRPPRTAAVVPATLLVVVAYNVIAIVTVVLFNVVLRPPRVEAGTYYAVCLAETLLAAAAAIIVQLSGVIQRGSSVASTAARGRIDALLAACDRIRAQPALQGPPVASALAELEERIRFSEGLRRDASLCRQVGDALAEVESISEPRRVEAAERLVRAASLMAARRT